MWQPKKILCPTDFSDGSEAAILRASDLAKQFGASICLLHVIPLLASLPADPRDPSNMMAAGEVLQDQSRRSLEKRAGQLKAAGLVTREVIAVGDAATQIVEAAEREQADLIVISTYGKTGWRRLAFGSVTEKVVRLAPCPVLTLRGRAKE